MSHKHRPETKKFDPANYPALRELFPAYLHQDYAYEYGSASGAIKGFLADANGDEIVQVREEWQRFRSEFQGRGFEEVQTALGTVGSAWLPENETQLMELDEIFRRAEA
jgi:hypothetical protein